MAQKVDIFICGSGSAGLAAATWLARCGIRCKIVDSRPGPLKVGQADGLQVRSVEIFESFGIVDELLREGIHNEEVVFWNTDPKTGGIVRTRSAPATTPGLSHLPRILLTSAKFNGAFLDAMRKFNGQEVDYGYKILKVEVDEEKSDDPEAYPVMVWVEKDGKEEKFEAKYALGCDGAHSTVRKSLGIKMMGDSSDSLWGVMDVYPQTNFPDIRKQLILQTDVGTINIIPREGGSLARIYIELAHGTKAKDVKLEDLQATARKIMRPYQLDFAETYWWSAYPIGQRLADQFSKSNRIFLLGDACHTHSPKAGQGANISLMDGYNLGWKLVQVLKGQASSDLLRTYNIDREKVAYDLINWDKVWVKQMSSMGKNAGGVIGANGEVDFSEVFIKAEPFTAGLTITYDDSSITSSKEISQEVATNILVGMRLPSTQVVRFCDGKAMQLIQGLPSVGCWRIVVFPGDIRKDTAARRLHDLGEYLFSKDGPIQKYLPPGADIDSFIEVLLVLSGERLKTQQEQIPDCFWPVTGKWRMRDLHKIYIDDESYHFGHGHAYDFYGISPEKGATVIVRPDNYVSMVLPVDEHKAIGDFFGGFALSKRSELTNGVH